MIRPRHPRRPRRGFTLVELLVAAALSVLIMAVMATAFQKGMDSLSNLKSVVGLSEQLRAAEGVMVRDLEAVHLEDQDGKAFHVSSPDVAKGSWLAGKRGYFSFTAPTPAGADNEGTGGDNMNSSRATNHSIRFTSRLAGTGQDQVFAAEAPGGLLGSSLNLADLAPAGQFASRWAEIRYYTEPTAFQSDPNGGSPLVLNTLYRRYRVLAPAPTGSGTTAAAHWNLSLDGANKMNTPTTVADPAKRPAVGQFAKITDPAGEGSDILLTNVVSFQVLALTGTVDQNGGVTARDNEFNTNTAALDTGANTGRKQLRAIQLKLRVYDPRNRITRQLTISQDL